MSGRKTGLAAGVLRMKVRRGKKEPGVLGRQFRRHTRDRGPVLRPHAGVDDQRGVATDHDGNVRKAHDRPDMVRDLRGVLTEHRVVALGKPGCAEQ